MHWIVQQKSALQVCFQVAPFLHECIGRSAYSTRNVIDVGQPTAASHPEVRASILCFVIAFGFG